MEKVGKGCVKGWERLEKVGKGCDALGSLNLFGKVEKVGKGWKRLEKVEKVEKVERIAGRHQLDTVQLNWTVTYGHGCNGPRWL